MFSRRRSYPPAGDSLSWDYNGPLKHQSPRTGIHGLCQTLSQRHAADLGVRLPRDAGSLSLLRVCGSAAVRHNRARGQ